MVKQNWKSKVVAPYSDWDPSQLTSFLREKGVDTKASTSNKQSLLDQVRGHWYETEDKTEDSWGNIKEWIFDRYGAISSRIKGMYSQLRSWSDSQLKAFADKHGIPVPQPRKRDTVLQHIRSNYETIAKKVGDTASYPGNWLYETWPESGKIGASCRWSGG